MKVLDRKMNISKTQKQFKGVVWIYDFWGKLTERKAIEKVMEWAAIKNGSAVLDVACGTGELFEKIVALNPDGKNHGIDVSPAMLEKAKQKMQNKEGHFDLAEGNALKLDFPDASFDVLINNYMVDLLPEDKFQEVANEFYRVLKPNGKIVISTFSFGTKKIHKFWYWVAHRFPALLTACRPVLFAKYLQKAGFNIEKQVEISQNTFPSNVCLARK